MFGDRSKQWMVVSAVALLPGCWSDRIQPTCRDACVLTDGTCRTNGPECLVEEWDDGGEAPSPGPSPVDGGGLDAGGLDAGLDAGLGPVDAGVMDGGGAQDAGSVDAGIAGDGGSPCDPGPAPPLPAGTHHIFGESDTPSKYLDAVMDGVGRTHVVYRNEHTQHVRYLIYDGTRAWSRAELVTDLSVMMHVRLVLDALDNPHLYFVDAGSKVLFHQYLQGGLWTREPVGPSVGQDPFRFGLVRDSSGDTWVLSLASSANELRLYRRTAQGWSHQVVKTGSSIGLYSELAIDAHDTLHLFFSEGGGPPHAVGHYGTYQAGNLQLQQVVSVMPGMPAIALAPSGPPSLFFRDGNRVMHAEYLGGAWTTSQMGTLSDPLTPLDATRDSAGTLHVVYPIYTGVQHAMYQNGSWKTLAMHNDFGAARWTRGAHPGTQAVVSTRGDVHAAQRTGTQWTLTSNSFPETGATYPSVAVDASGRPHVVFQGPESGLTYGVWTASGWKFQSLPTYDFMTTLRLDAQGRPHLFYFTATDVRHAYCDNGVLTSEVVAPANSYLPHSVSGDLDPAGNPHVSYTYDGKAIRYAYKTSNGWTDELIDNGSINLGDWQVLRVDAQGVPHVAYTHWNQSNLSGVRHATRVNGSWTKSDLESSNLHTYQVDLGLMNGSTPWVLYSDNTQGQLKLARWLNQSWVKSTLATVNGGSYFFPRFRGLGPGGGEVFHLRTSTPSGFQGEGLVTSFSSAGVGTGTQSFCQRCGFTGQDPSARAASGPRYTVYGDTVGSIFLTVEP